MITGDNPKLSGQENIPFGNLKGSGENNRLADIKKKIGYYSPAMTNKFKRQTHCTNTCF